MNSAIQKILLLMIAVLSLYACGDDAKFNSDDVSTITQKIYVVPERYNDEPYTFNYPSDKVYLEVDQVVKFWAVYIIDDYFLQTDLYDEFIVGKDWEINGEYFNINSFRYSFSKPGKSTAILKSVDKMNDTISDTMAIYVNTPISAKLVFPENGYNLVDPKSEQGIDLVWDVSGHDEWEKSSCTIFASYSEQTVWASPQATGKCDEPGHIRGPLYPDAPSNATKIIYWGVVATHYTDDGFEEQDTTSIYSFSTKFSNTDSAEIILPVTLSNLWSSDSVKTVVTLTNSKGDTLSSYIGYKYESRFDMRVLPQTGLNIYIEETRKKDYESQKITLDITDAALYKLETVTLTDSIAPYIEPTSESFPQKSFISFYAIDNGSGISRARIAVTNGLDTLASTYVSSTISFEPPIFSSYCYVKISVQDNAKNNSPLVYWKLERIDERIRVTGPYSEWEVNHD